MIVAAVVLLACLVAGLAALIARSGGALSVPRVLGLTYEDAKQKVEKAGLAIEIDPMQDSSGDCAKLKVETQDPKPGTETEKGEVVVVRLKGLHDSPELTKNAGADEPAEPAQPQQETAAQVPQPTHTICLDPGHSNRTGSETDPATGLNVGDNTGAAGEMQAMWDLALSTKTRLEQAGYTVRLTKSSANSYASLRARADIGNTCDITIRLHYDDTGFTGVMRAPVNGARCPVSNPSRITVVDPNVAGESNRLAGKLASALGLAVRDDTGGTSQGNGTPAGHPTALIGSVLSRVPVVCVENKVSLVRGNPTGREQVAEQILQGINAYFQGG